MQLAGKLKILGGLSYVPGLVSVSLLRELGPLLIGVIVIGRSGSAVTAELGTMKVSEMIENPKRSRISLALATTTRNPNSPLKRRRQRSMFGIIPYRRQFSAGMSVA